MARITVSKIRRYFELRSEIEDRKEQLDALKMEMMDGLYEEPKQTLTELGHTFTIQERKSWQYSDDVKRLAADLRDAKRYEERHGIAECTKIAGHIVCRRERGA